MTVRTWIETSVVVVACLSGCGKPIAQEGSALSARATGGVGVVDLDVVAKRLGSDLEMSKAVQERLTSLNEKLTTLTSSLNRLYDEKRGGFGDEPNEDQQQQLQTMEQRMKVQLGESKRKAETDLAAYKQALVDRFREQAKPVLRDVAAARGLSIVVPKNNGLLLTIDPAVEITDEVADRMLAALPRPAKPSKAKAEPETETSAR